MWATWMKRPCAVSWWGACGLSVRVKCCPGLSHRNQLIHEGLDIFIVVVSSLGKEYKKKICGNRWSAEPKLQLYLFLPWFRSAAGMGEDGRTEQTFKHLIAWSTLLLWHWNFFLFYVYECFASMYVCVPGACLVPSKVKRGCRILWYRTYRCF